VEQRLVNIQLLHR